MKTYQIYCDRGNGNELDGCWGSEHARFDNREDAEEAAKDLEASYPDCAWNVVEEETENTLRIHKIYIFGDRMADVTHSEGMTRIALNDEHFINGDQGTDEKCLSCDGGEYLEQELKRLTGCDDVEWAN